MRTFQVLAQLNDSRYDVAEIEGLEWPVFFPIFTFQIHCNRDLAPSGYATKRADA